MGLVGGSIEDASGDKDKPLYDLGLATERVAAAVEAARTLSFPFTLTARTENFLRGTAATVANFREAADVELAQAVTLNDNAFKIAMVRNTVASLLAGLTRRQVGDTGGDLAGQEQKS